MVQKSIGSVPKYADLNLSDHADGVQGHYCVGFTDEQGTRWSWNQAKGGYFGAYGTVIVGAEAANALLTALQRAHNLYVAGESTIKKYRESEDHLNKLLNDASNETREAWRKLGEANGRISDLEAVLLLVRERLGSASQHINNLLPESEG